MNFTPQLALLTVLLYICAANRTYTTYFLSSFCLPTPKNLNFIQINNKQ